MRRTARILGNSARGLARNRLRTFFMMLGTFVGVCALTLVLAIGRGTQRDMLEKVERMLGGWSMFVSAGGARMRGGPRDPANTTLTLEDVRAVVTQLDPVEVADPAVFGGPKEVVYGGRSRQIRVEGHAETAEVVWNRSVTRGSYFSEADVARTARVALVGEVVVRELFEGRDPIGEQIRIGAVPFRVIGILEPVGVDPHGLDKDDEIIVPISTMMRRVLNVDYIFGAKLGLRPGTDFDRTVQDVRAILRRRHALGPDQPDDFATHTPEQVQQMVRSANRVFTVFLPLIAAVSILVGGLVVANLMLVTVHERRAEIGLRKAIGARPRDILLQFLAESAAVTGLGGVFAVATGLLALTLVTMHGATVPGMPWTVALLGLASAVTVGVVAGVIPARRAARLDPVRTLR